MSINLINLYNLVFNCHPSLASFANIHFTDGSDYYWQTVPSFDNLLNLLTTQDLRYLSYGQI